MKPVPYSSAMLIQHEWLSTAEAAERLGMSMPRIYQLLQQQRVKGTFHIGRGSWVIPVPIEIEPRAKGPKGIWDVAPSPQGQLREEEVIRWLPPQGQVREEEARRWLLQAQNDLESATYSMGGGFHAQSCFMAQQSAEKALKALVYMAGARHLPGHSVRELLDGLLESHPRLERQQEAASRLDQYYTPRYPNSLPGVHHAPFQHFTHGQAQEAVQGAAEILAEVSELVVSRGDGVVRREL